MIRSDQVTPSNGLCRELAFGHGRRITLKAPMAGHTQSLIEPKARTNIIVVTPPR